MQDKKRPGRTYFYFLSAHGTGSRVLSSFADFSNRQQMFSYFFIYVVQCMICFFGHGFNSCQL